MADDRFGPNGVVMDSLSDAMRVEHEAAARRDARTPRWVLLLVLATVILVASSAYWPDLPSLDWYAPPSWLWPAWMIALSITFFLPLARRVWRRVRRGEPLVLGGAPTGFDRAIGVLPMGVLLAGAVEAVIQYRAADAAVLLP